MTIVVRDMKAPVMFIEAFELIELVMSIVQSEIREGKLSTADCCSIAHALAKSFSNFRVVTGRQLRTAPCSFSKGSRRSCQQCHSWLVWKQNGNFIIDVWPLGSIPGCTLPVAYTKSEFFLLYGFKPSNVGVADKKRALIAANDFHPHVTAILNEIGKAYDGSSQKTPS